VIFTSLAVYMRSQFGKSAQMIFILGIIYCQFIRFY